ncbi:MAG: ATP-binding protein [Spirochaetales bacterium]|nr:ATP-binding protein [Spirochaetales bacterium]
MEQKYENNITYPIKAVYSKPILEIDNDNIFIKALPDKMSRYDISGFYYEKFPIVPSIDAEPFVQEEEIHLLENMRLPLEPVYELETTFRSILTTSYRKRLSWVADMCCEVTVNDEKQVQEQSMSPMTDGDGHTGAALLGIGGCGKTCAVNRLLSRYPQTLIHENPGSGTTIQIVWLYVQPSSNSDLSALMDGIGIAIDTALGNSNRTYERLIKAQKKLGPKADKIAELFRVFNVGILVIDEIQRFSSFSNKDDSYETIMTITNKSKTGLMVVGTEEAYGKFFSRYYIARRMGSPIKASKYCVNYDYFKAIAKLVMSVQWFRTPQAITEEIYSAMYQETSGIIERIISVWENVQICYVNLSETEKNGFVLTPEFISKTSTETNPLLGLYARQTLKADVLSSMELEDNRVGDKGKPNKDKAGKAIAEFRSSTNPLLAQEVFTRTKRNLVEAGEVYSDEYILDNVNKVLKLKTNAGKPEDELIATAIKRIRKNRKQLINTGAIEHNNAVRNEGISRIDLAGL